MRSQTGDVRETEGGSLFLQAVCELNRTEWRWMLHTWLPSSVTAQRGAPQTCREHSTRQVSAELWHHRERCGLLTWNGGGQRPLQTLQRGRCKSLSLVKLSTVLRCSSFFTKAVVVVIEGWASLTRLVSFLAFLQRICIQWLANKTAATVFRTASSHSFCFQKNE